MTLTENSCLNLDSLDAPLKQAYSIYKNGWLAGRWLGVPAPQSSHQHVRAKLEQKGNRDGKKVTCYDSTRSNVKIPQGVSL